MKTIKTLSNHFHIIVKYKFENNTTFTTQDHRDRWAPGVKDLSIAPPLARAVCRLCRRAVIHLQVRVAYRWRRSRALADETFIHLRCMGTAPERCLDGDIAQIDTWAAQPDLEQNILNQLEEMSVLLHRRRDGPGGSSGV